MKSLCGTVALLALLASGCGSDKTDDNARRQHFAGTVVSQGSVDPHLVGAWRILGEGALLEVTASGATQFQEGSSLCYIDKAASTGDVSDLAGMHYSGEFNGAEATVELFELAGAPPSQTLQRISAIPSACRARPAPDAATTFKAMCELMALDYAFFKEHKIDWPARCAALAPRAAAAGNDDALQGVLIEALSGFNDAHVKLYRGSGEARVQVYSAGNAQTAQILKAAFAQQTEVDDLRLFQLAWRDEVRGQAEQRLSAASGPQLEGALHWGRLPGNVGYIALYRMLGFSSDATTASDVALAGKAMDRAIAELADTRALIVDISTNGGGQDVISAEFAARFADQGRLAFTTQFHRAQGTHQQSWWVEPKGKAQYRKPVYLLTSDLTGSAAETFTLMMRQFPQVIHAGQTTAGAISDIVEKSLPGNFTVSFSNQIDLDPKGVSFEAVGIAPALRLPMFDPADPETLLTGHAAAISALIDAALR